MGIMYTKNRERMHPLCERLIARHLLSPNFFVSWKGKVYPYLYALIDEEKWMYAHNLLNNGASSTVLFCMLFSLVVFFLGYRNTSRSLYEED